MNDFITIYTKAFQQLKHNWVRILGWTAILSFIPILYLFYIPSAQFTIQFANEAGLGIPNSIVLSVLFMMVICIFLPLSLSHLGVATARDSEESFLTVGSYGFTHPLRSLRFMLSWYLIMLMISLLMYGLIIILVIIPFLGIIVASVLYKLWPLTLLLFGLFYFYIMLYMLYSSLNMVEYEDEWAFSAIAKSKTQLKGWKLHVFGILLPVYILLWGIVVGWGASISLSSQHEILENKLAIEALDITIEDNVDSRDEFANLLRYTTFHEEKPEYEGDIDSYRQALANYTVAYEKFHADKEKRAVSDEIQTYIDMSENGTRSSGVSILIMFGIILAVFFVVAYALTIVVQLYRTTTGELDEENRKEQENFRRVELVHKLGADSSGNSSADDANSGRLLYANQQNHADDDQKEQAHSSEATLSTQNSSESASEGTSNQESETTDL